MEDKIWLSPESLQRFGRSKWTPLEHGLDEWEELCEQLEDTSSSGGDQDSVHATLRSMARMLARSQKAQALQGRTSTLLARQVVSCMRGTEAETLAKTGVRDCAEWAQQVQQLNTELKVQRYSWQQLHSTLMKTQAAVQAKEEELLVKEQDILLAREEADALRLQHGSRTEGTRHLLEAKQQEVLQLQAELERREAECGRLKQVLAEGPPQGAGREERDAAAAVGTIEARVRARLHSAGGSSSSEGGPPADSSVPIEEFKSWKEKLIRKTARIIASDIKAKDAEISSLQQQLRAQPRKNPLIQQGIPAAPPPPLHPDGGGNGTWHSDEDEGHPVEPACKSASSGTATGHTSSQKPAAKEQQWRRQLLKKLEGLRCQLGASSSAAASLAAGGGSALPPEDLSQEQQWRAHGMAWVAGCIRELSVAADAVVKDVAAAREAESGLRATLAAAHQHAVELEVAVGTEREAASVAAQAAQVQAVGAVELRMHEVEAALVAAQAAQAQAVGSVELRVQEAEAALKAAQARGVADANEAKKASAELECRCRQLEAELLGVRLQLEEGAALALVEQDRLRGELAGASSQAEGLEGTLRDVRLRLVAAEMAAEALRGSSAELGGELEEAKGKLRAIEQQKSSASATRLAQAEQKELAASATRLAQAEASLNSERELSESLGEEVAKLQARMVSLQQEHSNLKREAAMLAERAAMSEEGREEDRLDAEAAAETAQAKVDALSRDLIAAQRQVKDTQAAAAAAAAGARQRAVAGRSSRVASTSGAGSSPGSGGPSPPRGAPPAPGLSSELLEARAHVSALEQELQVTRGSLSALIAAGQAACDEQLRQGGAAPGTLEGAGLRGLLGVLRCTELLYTKEERGASLARIRVLQAQLESGLQAALQGHSTERPALLQELQSLLCLQERLERQMLREAPAPPTRPAMPAEATDLPRGDGCTANGAGGDGMGSKPLSPPQVSNESSAERLHPDQQHGDEEWPLVRQRESEAGWEFNSLGSSELAGVGGPSQLSSSLDLGMGLLGDDVMDGIDAWELPPLPPPPCFD